MKNRIRTVPFTPLGNAVWKPNGEVVPYNGSYTSFVETMIQGDTGHYGYPDFPDNSNVGGDFWLETKKLTVEPTVVQPAWTGRTGSTYNYTYYGQFILKPRLISLPPGESSPAAWGPDAYSKMKPTQPLFPGLNFISELRELPRMLSLRFQKNSLATIGNYFLAYQFGWKLLLRDVRALVDLQRRAQLHLAQLLRDDGKPVRRRVELQNAQSDPVTYVSSASAGNFNPVLYTYSYNGWPTLTDITKESDRVWASAQFRYHLPGGPRDIKWTGKMLNAIYGLNPSPSVVYNAIPWTWLLDWFTTVGDAIENMEAGVADTIAADYFYVMRERSIERESFGNLFLRDIKGNPVTYTGSAREVASIKRRIKGDPFGFMTDQSTLSGMQLAIMGALGLSRLR